MEIRDEDSKIITEALIKASNYTETEWLNLEKTMVGSFRN